MTREEWEREVDALAAEHVRDWQWREYNAFGEPTMGLFPPPPSGAFRDHDRYGSPTRSISDAWKLVEAMEDEGWTWLANHCEDRKAPYVFVFSRRDGGYGKAQTASPALSITLASLRAVGAEIPEEPTDE